MLGADVDVRVRIDESREQVLAAPVDHARRRRRCVAATRSNENDRRVANDHGHVCAGRRSGSVDQRDMRECELGAAQGQQQGEERTTGTEKVEHWINLR